jgi:hypothetical protein
MAHQYIFSRVALPKLPSHLERVQSLFKMLTRIAFTSTVLAALAAAAPAPQVAGYTNADASFSVSDPVGSIATSFGEASQIPVSVPICSTRVRI